VSSIDLKNPGMQKIILSVALAGGVVGVFFFTHFLPFGYPNQSEKLAVLKADFEQKSAELARARTTVADLPRFEAEYEQLHERWSMAAELLPTDRELPTLLRRVTLAAQQTGCVFVSFRPSAPQQQQYYTQMPMQIQVNGGYHQVGSFLAELANLRRIITVSGVHLKPNSKADGIQTTTAEFTASAYSLNTGSAPAAASSAKPADAKKEGDTHARKAS
jgi:type IV pilus assembly protein PilO